MAEEGECTFHPIVEVKWDDKGVEAYRTFRQRHPHPVEAVRNDDPKMGGDDSHERNESPKHTIDDLYNRVQSLVGERKASLESDLADIRAERDRLQHEQNKGYLNRSLEHGSDEERLCLAKLFRLTDAYELLCGSGEIRRWCADRRRIDPLPERFETPLALKVYYLACPVLLFMLCFGIQSALLHLATKFYVEYMTVTTAALNSQAKNGHAEHSARLYDILGEAVGDHTGDDQVVGAISQGQVQVPMLLLDASGFLPLLLCFGAYVYSGYKKHFNIGLWNKTFIVASCMALLKGVFDVVTIMPDSMGWRSCQQRLGHGGQSAVADISGVQGLLHLELFGGKNRGRVRYCADMMVSGHTYFATLFSLSAYKQIHYSGMGRCAARCVGLVCLLCVCTEIVLVAAARFHYTVDMLAAVVLVVLLFDSTYVEQIASDWAEGFHHHDPENFTPHLSPIYVWVIKPLRRRGPGIDGLAALNFSSRRADFQVVPDSGASCDPLVASPPEERVLIASRATSLVNARVTGGLPPWAWRTHT